MPRLVLPYLSHRNRVLKVRSFLWAFGTASSNVPAMRATLTLQAPPAPHPRSLLANPWLRILLEGHAREHRLGHEAGEAQDLAA